MEKTNAPAAAGSYAVTAAVTDSSYEGSAQGILIIQKASPKLTWVNPGDVEYGTLLTASQLNAMADISGSFAYNPAIGTTLNAGIGQSLTGRFHAERHHQLRDGLSLRRLECSESKINRNGGQQEPCFWNSQSGIHWNNDRPCKTATN